MESNKAYDVIVAGGGLAGLTLALQLKQAQADLTILVLEKRLSEAPMATHKVGESTSELAAVYLREKLQLSKYLDEHQLLKFGLRFYFRSQSNTDFSRRIEVGTRIGNFYPTHQLDRGLLENELAKRVMAAGVDLHFGAKVKDLKISKTTHTVLFEKDGHDHSATAKWLVDSTGRNHLLKRKFGLQKEVGHHVNAVWFRLNTEIDIGTWSDRQTWQQQIPLGLRRLATNHLMGEGYWVWLIPLVSGSTSIGIVADPAFHPFEQFNTFEKAMNWLEKYEPFAAEKLSRHQEQLMDFKVMKNFAFDSKHFFSADRWAVTGEAGAFMDPFYSPGSDFIALGNTWICDLIVRDLAQEDIALRLMIYELALKELFAGWILLYQNMYGIFGKSKIMLMKIVWDWASYWGVPCVLFVNNGYTNISVLKRYSSSDLNLARRFGKLNEKMQALFNTWGKYENSDYCDFCGNLFDLGFFRQLQAELSQKYSETQLIGKIKDNVNLLEKVASEIFRMVSFEVLQTPVNMNVNPYEMSLDDGKQSLLKKSELNHTFEVDPLIKSDLEKMWLIPVKEQTNG